VSFRIFHKYTMSSVLNNNTTVIKEKAGVEAGAEEETGEEASTGVGAG
jgi:hypothetical protein